MHDLDHAREHVGIGRGQRGVIRGRGQINNCLRPQDAVELCGLLDPQAIVPIHYEGWKHFRQGRSAAERVFTASPLAERVHWLEAGKPTDLTV